MNQEQIKKITANAIEELAASLIAGRSETLETYLATMSRFHRYSLHNVMLIALQRPTASRVAGFHNWRKLGRFVRKGEKGIVILAPLVRNKPVVQEVPAEELAPVLYGFRATCVFDVAQTEGRDLPDIGRVQGDPQEYLTRLVNLVHMKDITLDYSADIAPALGTSAGGKITLLPGMEPAQEFSTLVHELAHLCGVGNYVALGVGVRENTWTRLGPAPHNLDQRLDRNSITLGLLRHIFFGCAGLPVSHAANALAFISRSTSA
jgi:hypothetical protein